MRQWLPCALTAQCQALSACSGVQLPGAHCSMWHAYAALPAPCTASRKHVYTLVTGRPSLPISMLRLPVEEGPERGHFPSKAHGVITVEAGAILGLRQEGKVLDKSRCQTEERLCLPDAQLADSSASAHPSAPILRAAPRAGCLPRLAALPIRGQGLSPGRARSLGGAHRCDRLHVGN